MGGNSLDAYCVQNWLYFFTLSKYCDFFRNALIKTDLSLFRQLWGYINIFNLFWT